MKEKLAVIGSGIAGMASAYYLRDHFDVHLFESNTYIGGHTNTRFVQDGENELPIDTGFMVFNDHTYPNLVKLFAELEVTSYPTSMSFGVQNKDTGLEYSSAGAKGFFAQKSNVISPKHWRLLKGIKHFFLQASDTLESQISSKFTLRDFAETYNISEQALQDFIIPMAGAIWSTPPKGILNFPALPMLRFMNNHRMLGIGTQYQWKTVEGGSEQYKSKLLAKLRNKPVPGLGVNQVLQNKSEVLLTLSDGSSRIFDHAILATHADDALRLLTKPTPLQQTLLSSFQYNRNTAVLHSDESVMPEAKAAWASWNVSHQRGIDSHHSATHYWMNSLQRLDTNKNYFVSIDPHQPINENHTHWKTQYKHPRFDTAAIDAQKILHTLNNVGRLRFCGSYFRNGFHEDALWSALEAVNSVLKLKEVRHEFATL